MFNGNGNWTSQFLAKADRDKVRYINLELNV